jgi:hypothetical protein
MQLSGGLMIAVNSVTSNMPRFETVKVEPMNSSGLSFLSRARAASSFTSREISTTCLRSAFRTTGVMRPSARETATPRCTSAWVWMASPVHEALTTGKRVSAFAQALRTRSL